ncbi:MAG: hypothetical protein Q8O91_10995, partial [Candidatus Aminicenantes bacterium]|nr:hypothetical protein [Candidatus Aminicenantes bacterium]
MNDMRPRANGEIATSSRSRVMARNAILFKKSSRGAKRRGDLTFLILFFMVIVGSASASTTNPQKWSGSQTTPVHQIP